MITEEFASSLSEDDLCEAITKIKTQIKPLEQDLAILLGELSERFDDGKVDGNFSHNDFSFAFCLGKVSYNFPDDVTTMEQTLKQAKEAAKANGTATPKLGKSFWTINFPS